MKFDVRLLGALMIFTILTGVIAYAALTPSFSDAIWQVPTFKADNYYIGSTNITSNLTAATLYPEAQDSFVVWLDGATYYAKNGHTGAVTSNANAVTLIQSCVNAIRGTVNHALNGLSGRVDSDGVIIINSDLAFTSGQIDLADIRDLTIDGNGHKITISTNDAIIFDCSNSENIHFNNIEFYVAATYHPDVLILFARDVGGASCEFNSVTYCEFKDTDSAGMDIAFIYNLGSELNSYNNDRFYHLKDAVIISSDNSESVTSSYKTLAAAGSAYSMRGTGFIQSSFTKQHYETVYPYYSLTLEGAGETTIDQSYFGLGGGNYTNYALYADLTYNALYGLNVLNTKFEGRAFLCGGASILQTLMGVHFKNNYFFNEADDSGEDYFGLNQANTQISNWVMSDNIFHTGLNFELNFPITSLCKFDFRNSWTEPVVTFNQYWDTTLTMWNSTKANITTFGRGEVKFILTGGGTENSGSSTVANGATSKYVAHGCIYTPDANDINYVFTENPTNGIVYQYIGNITSMGFTLYCNDPGASNLDFSWTVRRTP